MQSSVSPIVYVELLSGILAIIGIVVGVRVPPQARSPKGTAMAALPGLLMLALFYTLAFHMYKTLGGWPKSSGEHGFPEHLIIHADITLIYVAILYIIVTFAWPVAFVVCAVVRRWRVGLYYAGVFVVICFGCAGAMMMAPAPFLKWFLD